MSTTSSTRRAFASRSAVAVAWANGFVVTPSTTGRPPSIRLPAQGARRTYEVARTQVPATPMCDTSPMSPRVTTSVTAASAAEPRL